MQLINSQLNERSHLTICTHCAMIKSAASVPRMYPLPMLSRLLFWVCFGLLITSHRLAPPHGADEAYRMGHGESSRSVSLLEK